MSNVVVMGAQWGDEGKGKIVDLLTRKCDVIVRFQGGNNAGHTVLVGDRQYILHLIPSGILHPGKKCLIGNGVVLDPAVFCREVETLRGQDVDVSPARLMISRKTHVIMPYHKALDMARERHKSNESKIGTTGRGIGPCYEDKMSRIGIRAADLAMPELLRAKIEAALLEKNALLAGLYGGEPMTVDAVFDEIMDVAPRVVPHLADVTAEIEDAWAAGRHVMFEGAQGTHLDIDHGTYPFVTSSNTVSGNAAAGSGVAPTRLDRIVAIVKAYTTRVGAGPFPTEQLNEAGDYLQQKGHEFGATTGRKRRCGWLDAVVLREAVRLNGPTDIALTKLDVLSGLKELKICTAYEYQGGTITVAPQEQNGMAHVTPVYETMPGWDEDITGCTTWESLPEVTRAYIARIEELTGVRVSLVSVGPERDQTISRGW
ncbi:adenylosuccinate synthase [Nitratidesulfovibrio sp. D1]|uniref:adenylosuccinate synthase n=1 Tax=Nitratidesulfovibrio sp. D1 TaxID=3440151 RepID=UPI003EBAB3A2